MDLTKKIQKGLKELSKKLNEPINFPDWAPAGLALWMPSIIAEIYGIANMNAMMSNPFVVLPIAGAQIGGLLMADYECGEYAHKKGKGTSNYISFTYSGEMN